MEWFQHVLASRTFPTLWLLEDATLDIPGLRSFAEKTHVLFYHLHGHDISTKEDFFRAAIQVFAFPTVAVPNWDVFLDYVRGIPWEDTRAESYAGVCITYSAFDGFASTEPTNFALVCGCFEQMQEEQWQFAQIPCHFVLSGNGNSVPSDVLVEHIP
jgi:hypothetical protein